MKLILIVLAFFVAYCHATPRQNIFSPSDIHNYMEVVNTLTEDHNIDNHNQQITGRITNGTLAQVGQFPHQVYLYLLYAIGTKICGGSLIHPRWVLTAGHCVFEAEKIEVYFGAINRYGDGRSGSYVKFLAVTNRRSIVLHENYEDFFDFDIALIELPQDAPIDNAHVGVISLPRGVDISRTFANTQGTASGFGRVSDSASASSNDLYYMEGLIMSNADCGMYYFGIYDSHVCIEGVNGRSTCSGDSGGPLTAIGQDNLPILVGITSYGKSIGCEMGYPQVFTRVASYIPWIESKTGLTFS